MKISVIVPIYNMEKYLDQCLESIKNQTFTDFEVLMIDDGSVDHSKEICMMYEKNDDRFCYLYQENGGLSAARNYGIKESKGDYLCFVDSDDMINDQYLDILYKNAILYHADISLGYFKRFYDGELEKTPVDNWPCCLDKIEVYRRLTVVGEVYENTNLIVAWNKLIRREIIEKIQFLPGKWHEDEFWIHHIIAEASIIVETKSEIYYYRQRRDSIIGISNQSDIRHLDLVDAFEDRVRLYKNQINKEVYKEMVYAYRSTIAIHYRTKWNVKNIEQEKAIKRKLKKRFLVSFLKYPVVLSLSHMKHSLVFIFNVNINRRRFFKNK